MNRPTMAEFILGLKGTHRTDYNYDKNPALGTLTELQNWGRQMGVHTGTYGEVESSTAAERRARRDARIQGRKFDSRDPNEDTDQMDSAYHRRASRSFLRKHGEEQGIKIDDKSIDKIVKGFGDSAEKIVAKP